MKLVLLAALLLSACAHLRPPVTTEQTMAYLQCKDLLAKFGASNPHFAKCLSFVVKYDEAIEARRRRDEDNRAAVHALGQMQYTPPARKIELDCRTDYVLDKVTCRER